MASNYIDLPGGLGGTIMNSSLPSAIDATKIGNGSVTNAQFQALTGVSASIQTQIDAKEPVITSGSTAQYLRGDKTLATLNQSAVAGLTTADSPVFASTTISGAVKFLSLGGGAVGTTLVVDVSGNIRPLLSTRDSKENIRPLDIDPRVLLNLPTYSFNYVGTDPEEDVTHGFIAEEVAEIAPSLVINKDGVPYSLQHVEFIAPMLELIKLHHESIHVALEHIAKMDGATSELAKYVINQPQTFWQRLKWLFTGRC